MAHCGDLGAPEDKQGALWIDIEHCGQELGTLANG
jgi:hypothetical protein